MSTVKKKKNQGVEKGQLLVIMFALDLLVAIPMSLNKMLICSLSIHSYMDSGCLLSLW